MPSNFRLKMLVSTAFLSLPAFAHAQEVVTYVYDDLGRLIVTRTSGGVRDGQEAGTSFDPAGNHTNYRVSGVGGVPTPSPANNPPVTAVDSLTVNKCSSGEINAIVNRSGPEDNVSLEVTGVQRQPGQGVSLCHFGVSRAP